VTEHHPTKFSDEKLESLRTAMGHKITKEALSTQYDGLEFAKSRYLSLAELYSPGKFNDAKECIQRIDKALLKILSNKGKAEVAWKSIFCAIADCKRYAPGALKELDAFGLLNINIPKKLEPGAFRIVSTFEALTERANKTSNVDDLRLLRIATTGFLTNCKTPGRGEARREARKYIPGIQALAETFREALPDCALSDNENTLFPLYVKYWLEHFIGVNIVAPDRHIRHALEDLEHWEKITF